MINHGKVIVFNVGGGSSISGGGGRDVSFERGKPSNAPLWWEPSLVPPVSSLVYSGLLSGGGLLSEVVVGCILATLLGVKDKVVRDIKEGMGR